MERLGPLRLPEDPALAAMAVAMQEAGHWADIVDRDWRLVYSTDDMCRIMGGLTAFGRVAVGEHYFGPVAVDARLEWRSGPNTLERIRELFTAIGGWILADTPGGHDRLRDLVHPALGDLVERLATMIPSPAGSFSAHGMHVGEPVLYFITIVRIYDATGRQAGTALIMKPAAGMAVRATVAVGVDARHFERMQHVAKAARRPAAILFADLEGSSPLARRLPSSWGIGLITPFPDYGRAGWQLCFESPDGRRRYFRTWREGSGVANLICDIGRAEGDDVCNWVPN